ncbi:transporter [Shewanella sp. NFH-SH190041]|uniref:lysine exporter LysO family protein n=1 Tax=Shewanella sp. NFH-SH190041 TaxID=2950245 RepID=UPI0021C41D2E|nr:lysine exporter LysO family protein [Shewanella sp. NFH-SH190041]BDM65608.1 transporter [Shewanella sp. NFH-SH190041]
MLSGLLFVIVPLLLGYCVKLQQVEKLRLIDLSCSRLVVVILFLMGLSLAKMDQLGHNLGQILHIAGVLFICISACNLLVLPILDRCWQTEVNAQKTALPIKAMLLGSGKLILAVVLGLLSGLTARSFFPGCLFWVDSASEGILLLLLLLIGISLRNSAMPLKQILLNTKGIVLALLVALSSLPGGMLAAIWLEIPLTQGLAMASGFGWYSLTGILVTDHLGPVLGGGAFLNELLREMVAILIIPALIARFPATSVGYAGATAMDFTLPVIQQSGGNKFVPIAIVSGFILSLLVPVLITFFLTL